MNLTSRRGLGRVLIVLAALAGLTLMAAPASAAPPTIPAPTFTLSRASAVHGQAVVVTFVQKKVSNRPAATGQVTFTSGGDGDLATVALNGSGIATVSFILPIGDHVIDASYTGDVNYPSAQLTGRTVTVARAATATVVTSTKTTVPKGKAAGFSARTTRSDPWSGTLFGTTRFTATASGQAPVTADRPTGATGLATWAPVLAEARWSVTAEYLGNDSWLGSTSAPIEQVVGNPPPDVSTIDQSNPAAGRISGYTRGPGASLGQGFTAGRSGTLDKVTVGVADSGGVTLAVSIRLGSPDGAEVGSGQGVGVSGAVTLDIVLDRPAPVAAGTTYVMVVTPVDGAATFRSTSDNNHPGTSWELYAGVWYPDTTTADLVFATWVL